MDGVWLYRALREIRPEVIYQRVACGYTGIAAHYARHNGARLIWHVAHDRDLMPQDKMMEGRNPVRRLLEKRSIEYGIRHAHRIIVQTESQAAQLALNYARRADAVVRNFHPEPREPLDKSGAARVLWIANVKPWKQPEVFIRLAAALRELAGVRFIMVGALDGKSGGAQWQRALVRSIEATPNLEHVGPKSQPEVNELLAQAHVFVNTSVEEGYPNTFIQAWLREVPVVSLNSNPDGVLEREGIGMHAQSEARLVEAVKKLLNDRVLRDEYGARARRHAMLAHSFANALPLVRLLDTDELEQKSPTPAPTPAPTPTSAVTARNSRATS
jgi:glycosyltransferase involved in cell wall biosynthesis